jgi:hypothetical protein
MGYIKIIPIHSFVDIITNSSTELFTADTNKDVEAVKEILQNIIDKYNVYEDTGYTMDMFGHIFKFSVNEFYKYIKNGEYKYNNPYEIMRGWFCDDSSEGIIKKRKENIKNKPYTGWHRDNNATFPHDIFKKYFVEKCKNKSVWDNECKNIVKELIDKVYNEINDNDIKKPSWWDEPCSVGYSYKTKISELDGQIIIIGESDNSIPYDIWDKINFELNAYNYHLG